MSEINSCSFWKMRKTGSIKKNWSTKRGSENKICDLNFHSEIFYFVWNSSNLNSCILLSSNFSQSCHCTAISTKAEFHFSNRTPKLAPELSIHTSQIAHPAKRTQPWSTEPTAHLTLCIALLYHLLNSSPQLIGQLRFMAFALVHSSFPFCFLYTPSHFCCLLKYQHCLAALCLLPSPCTPASNLKHSHSFSKHPDKTQKSWSPSHILPYKV